MNLKLEDLKDIAAACCVTIILNTHRTKPDNQKDPITLKNLIKEAEERLLATQPEKEAKLMVQRLYELESTIDHSYNLESLILFVNEDTAEYTRLPVEVENRVVIGTRFATRDLIRALHMNNSYFVLLISQHEARLIKAFNDEVVEEIKNPFPIENNYFHPNSKIEQSNANRQTNLIAEFYNRIDKEVNKIRKTDPFPVLIGCEEAQYYEYLKIADEKQSIYPEYLNQNRLDQKAHDIVSAAWKIVKQHTVEKNNERINELEQAVGSGNFLSDTNEIWQAIKQGRVRTLFIEQGKFQPAVIENDTIIYLNNHINDQKRIDDIYDKLINLAINHGGDVTFLPDGRLEKFNGFCAVTRY